jgi:uncharacterized membrane protein YkvI
MENKWYYILAIGFSYTVAIFGGAFASGREIMQFFGRFGSFGFWGVLLALALFTYFGVVTLITTCYWKTFDYKSYALRLYGEFMPEKVATKFFWAFEISYLFLCILILGIITATLASMFVEEFGMTYGLAIFIVAAIILFVVTLGGEIIRLFNFTITWVLLFAAVIVFAIAFRSIAGDSWRVITSGVGPGGGEWALSAILYVSYNLMGVIMITSLAEPIRDRFSAKAAGIIGGVGIGLLVLFEYVVCIAYYPEIVEETLPLWFVGSKTGSGLVRLAYDIILTGAILTTGIAVTYPPVKRFKPFLAKTFGVKREKLSNFLLSLIIILLGLGLSTFGLIPLVAKGFTAMGWIFTVVFLIPLAIFASKVAWKEKQSKYIE